ncbi:MAG: hypothetical protein RSC34_01835, partial [Alistipes sp.]
RASRKGRGLQESRIFCQKTGTVCLQTREVARFRKIQSFLTVISALRSSLLLSRKKAKREEISSFGVRKQDTIIFLDNFLTERTAPALDDRRKELFCAAILDFEKIAFFSENRSARRFYTPHD